MKITISSNINSIIKQSQNHLASNITKQSNILGAELVAAAKSSMDEPKTGRVYQLSRGAYHVASAPGEPLANITGSVKNSITYFMTGNIINFGGDNTALSVWEQRDKQQGNRPTLQGAIDKIFPKFKDKIGSIK